MSDQFKIIKMGNSSVLYDADIIEEPTLRMFDSDYHTNSETQQKNSSTSDAISAGSGIGRARVVYFKYQTPSVSSPVGVPMVLKHYYRGGMVARFVKDRYLGVDAEKSRAFKEWRLLKKMQALRLPVPVAVAARVERGSLFYRADLVTREIINTKTLADTLSDRKIDIELWKKIGSCIKRFHQQDIYHADLNARNIMLAESGEVYLIDFDNSYVRQGAASWKAANLARLNRSLMKFVRNTREFYYSGSDWDALLLGYGEEVP